MKLVKDIYVTRKVRTVSLLLRWNPLENLTPAGLVANMRPDIGTRNPARKEIQQERAVVKFLRDKRRKTDAPKLPEETR
jgi:hypothetical protein